jgi:N-acetyl sugar amidotransferase
MPSTRPRINFDNYGICNGCKSIVKEIDWNDRKNQLENLIDKSVTENSPYHCVVAWSGGKDSSSIALRLKQDFGLNPLLVTFSPLIPTNVGEINKRNLKELGFDSIEVCPKINISRILANRFFVERGDPKLHWNAGVNSAPIRIADKLRIPFIFYAEHGETKYGGRVLSETSERERDIDEILENQIGDDPSNWVSPTVNQNDLYHYMFPPNLGQENLKALYFAYFSHWDVNSNIEYIDSKMEFKRNPTGRTNGTFTDFDSLDDDMDDLYYYMQYIKFGFGRCLRDVARQIQHKRLTREEGLSLIRKYDGEFPINSINSCLEYLNINENDFEKIVDSHRSEQIWKRTKGKWSLRFPIKFEGE